MPMSEATAGTAARQPPRRIIRLAFVLALILIAVELALRIYTYIVGGPVIALARSSPVSQFVFVSDDPWRFDAKHGFLGKPGVRYLIGSINGGSVSCNEQPTSLWPGGELGAEWNNADIRIAFFGADDGLQQPDWNRHPWPSLLADELSRVTGRRVAVTNYSRPGVGPAQALVLAAEVAPAIGSHLVVVAPTTATLALDFVYRIVAPVEGTSVSFASSSPEVGTRPAIGMPIGPVVNNRVTKGWCHQMEIATRSGMTGLLRFDGVLNELQNQANVAALLISRNVTATAFSPRLALFGILRGRAPRYIGVRDVPRMPHRILHDPDLQHDSRVTASLAALNAAKIPAIVLHSPIYPELVERRLRPRLASLDPQNMDRLLTSLGRATGRPVLFMMDVLDRNTLPAGDQLVNDPEGDWQLRVAGTELYAALAARALAPAVKALRRDQ